MLVVLYILSIPRPSVGMTNMLAGPRPSLDLRDRRQETRNAGGMNRDCTAVSEMLSVPNYDVIH